MALRHLSNASTDGCQYETLTTWVALDAQGRHRTPLPFKRHDGERHDGEIAGQSSSRRGLRRSDVPSVEHGRRDAGGLPVLKVQGLRWEDHSASRVGMEDSSDSYRTMQTGSKLPFASTIKSRLSAARSRASRQLCADGAATLPVVIGTPCGASGRAQESWLLHIVVLR